MYKTRIEQEQIAKEIITDLLRKKFDTYKHYTQRESAKDVIVAARYYSFHNLADQMENDLDIF